MLKNAKSLAMAIVFGLACVAGAQADSEPSKIDIAIVWAQDNCDGIDIAEDIRMAATQATAGMSAADPAAKASEIEAAIEGSFDGDRSEYCEFIAEMAAGL